MSEEEISSYTLSWLERTQNALGSFLKEEFLYGFGGF